MGAGLPGSGSGPDDAGQPGPAADPGDYLPSAAEMKAMSLEDFIAQVIAEGGG